MNKIIHLQKVIVTLIFFLLLAKLQPAYSAFSFSDTFSGGYSNAWQINSNSIAPIPSTHGIGAASNSQWSDILLPINENAVYYIQFDLWINTDSAV